jgi:hypothetical protein
VAAATAATWMFAALLLTAGITKLLRPAATGAALEGTRLPSHQGLVRALGAGEVVLAGGVLLVGGTVLAAALAVAYGVFAGFTAYQARRGAGCGCFGDASAPATSVHVAVDAAGAALAIVAAIGGSPSLLPLAADPVLGAVTLLGVVLGAQLLRLCLTALPELAAAVALHRTEAGA